MRAKEYVFEKTTDVNAEMILYGRVYGLAGTDGRRRFVLVGLLWGTPIVFFTGHAFLLLGISMEHIFEPRLRDMR